MSTDTVMRFEIRRARNGWILKVERLQADLAEMDEMVCEERLDDEVECFAEFLRALEQEFGPTTSRYSPKRIYIVTEPGDKFEGHTGPDESS